MYRLSSLSILATVWFTTVAAMPTEAMKLVKAESTLSYSFGTWQVETPERWDPLSTTKFSQRLHILMPYSAKLSDPVYFMLGNQTATNSSDVFRAYELNGKPRNMIFVLAEHRGYGESLSLSKDQSVPSFITKKDRLADAHHLVKLLKTDHTGPFIMAGWSYGGALAIEYATLYPQDLNLLVVSSSPVTWPLLTKDYDARIRKNIGEALYDKIAGHIRALPIQMIFDESWKSAWFLAALTVAVAERAEMQKLLPLIAAKVDLPTLQFVEEMKDSTSAGKYFWKMAESLTKTQLTRDEALNGEYSFRTWFYQQCRELGMFRFADSSLSIFKQTIQDIDQQCQKTFGIPLTRNPDWRPLDMISNLKMPMIYVAGGKDPWFGLGLPVPATATSEVTITSWGRYIHISNGFHGPDRDDPAVAALVLKNALELLRP